MKITRRFIPIILVAVLVVGGLAYWLVWWETRQPNNTLRLEGHMEATETDLAFKVSGIIQYIFFQEGDWVTTNQEVAGLEAKDLKDEVDRARAALAAAKANLAKFEAGYRPQEIKEAEAQVGKTKADLVNKKLDYERYENLYKRKVVPGITRDKFEADYLMAKEAHKSAAGAIQPAEGRLPGGGHRPGPGPVQRGPGRRWNWPSPVWGTAPSTPR